MVGGRDADPELSAAARRQVACWLFGVCVGIVILVVFGGWVRLTHSGLSMADWRPVTGFLPPLTEAAWDAAFRLYAQTPEYRLINARDRVGLAASDRIMLETSLGHRRLCRSNSEPHVHY